MTIKRFFKHFLSVSLDDIRILEFNLWHESIEGTFIIHVSCLSLLIVSRIDQRLSDIEWPL